MDGRRIILQYARDFEMVLVQAHIDIEDQRLEGPEDHDDEHEHHDGDGLRGAPTLLVKMILVEAPDDHQECQYPHGGEEAPLAAAAHEVGRCQPLIVLPVACTGEHEPIDREGNVEDLKREKAEDGQDDEEGFQQVHEARL